MNKCLVIFTILLLSFIVSCNKKDNAIEDDYIREIEREYKDTINNDVVAETNNYYYENIITNSNRTFTQNNKLNSRTDAKKVVHYKNREITKPKKRNLKATVDSFYSPWTSKSDNIIIREIRVMIANKEYTKALNYINTLNFDNLPDDVDICNLYQFKGICHYFLSKTNKSHIALSDDSFKKVANLASIDSKFKPLSYLWNGMLYQTYSTDTNQLNEAIILFDKVITEYPRNRFANDALFYKALTLKKLGKPENEYNDILLAIKRGGFVDTLVFSQVINDYVSANDLVDKELFIK